MNAARRKDIQSAIEVVNKHRNELLELLKALAEDVSELAGIVDDIKSDEQDYFDNMPEGLQSGEKGEAAEEAITHLSDAQSVLESLCDDLQSDLEQKFDEIVEFLESAKGE